MQLTFNFRIQNASSLGFPPWKQWIISTSHHTADIYPEATWVVFPSYLPHSFSLFDPPATHLHIHILYRITTRKLHFDSRTSVLTCTLFSISLCPRKFTTWDFSSFLIVINPSITIKTRSHEFSLSKDSFKLVSHSFYFLFSNRNYISKYSICKSHLNKTWLKSSVKLLRFIVCSLFFPIIYKFI